MIAASLRPTVAAAVLSMTQTAAAGLVVEPYLWLRDYADADRRRRTGLAAPPARLRHGIVFDNVTLTYPGAARPAVDRLTVNLPAGSVVAVVGEYGSGKTTLVKLLNKFYAPDSGRILVDGVDLGTIDTVAWRARSSAAFQDFGRFRTRFAETVGLGDLANLDNLGRIEAAVRAADAEDLLARLPDGLRTPTR